MLKKIRFFDNSNRNLYGFFKMKRRVSDLVCRCLASVVQSAVLKQRRASSLIRFLFSGEFHQYHHSNISAVVRLSTISGFSQLATAFSPFHRTEVLSSRLESTRSSLPNLPNRLLLLQPVTFTKATSGKSRTQKAQTTNFLV